MKNNKPTSPKASANGRGGDGLLVQSPQHSETDPELSVEPQLKAFKTICEHISGDALSAIAVDDWPKSWVCKNCAWSRPSGKSKTRVWCNKWNRRFGANSDRWCYEEPLHLMERRRALKY